MSESDLPDDAGKPQGAALAEAVTKLRSATELLKQINEEAQAAHDESMSGSPEGPGEQP